ncbi:MAG: class I SAM-dependent methyltransferase [bacterium]|nr:class I SAM-dependent methyltransferase [bacterium]
MSELQEYLKHTPLHHAMWRQIEGGFYKTQNLPPLTLDIGCGDGLFAEIFFKDTPMIGIDLWENDLKRAKKRGVYKGICKAGATALPFMSNSFFSCVSNCTLEHIKEIDLAFAEIARVLKPKGLFAFTVPNADIGKGFLYSWWFEKIGFKGFSHLVSLFRKRIYGEYHNLTELEWTKKVEEGGFIVVKVEPFFGRKAMGLWSILFLLEAWRLGLRLIIGRFYLFPEIRRIIGPFFARWIDVRAWQENPAALFFLCSKKEVEK